MVAFFFFIFAIMAAGIFLAPFFIEGFFIPKWPGIGYLHKKTRPLVRDRVKFGNTKERKTR